MDLRKYNIFPAERREEALLFFTSDQLLSFSYIYGLRFKNLCSSLPLFLFLSPYPFPLFLSASVLFRKDNVKFNLPILEIVSLYSLLLLLVNISRAIFAIDIYWIWRNLFRKHDPERLFYQYAIRRLRFSGVFDKSSRCIMHIRYIFVKTHHRACATFECNKRQRKRRLFFVRDIHRPVAILRESKFEIWIALLQRVILRRHD